MIGVIAWVISGSSVVGLVCFLVADLVAAGPTIAKSWENYEEEDLFAWIITLLSGIINLPAIENWTFAIATPPVCYLAIYFAVTLTLVLSRRKQALLS